MAFTIHHKGKARVSDYERLDSKLLKATAHLPAGESLTVYYPTSQGQRPLTCRRGEEDIFIYWGKHCWKVHLRPHQLTYGIRYWLGCPGCGGRCSFLYITGHSIPLACRKCVRPAYTCQNSTELHYTSEKSQALRQKIWGTSTSQEFRAEEGIGLPIPDKPKGRWWRTFKRDFDRLTDIEKRWQASATSKYKSLIVNP